MRWRPGALPLHSKDRGAPPTGPFACLVRHPGLPPSIFSHPTVCSPPATPSSTSHEAIARCVAPPRLRLRLETKRNETKVRQESTREYSLHAAGTVRVRLAHEGRGEFLLGCVGRGPKRWPTCVEVADLHDGGSEEGEEGRVSSRNGIVPCSCRAGKGKHPLCILECRRHSPWVRRSHVEQITFLALWGRDESILRSMDISFPRRVVRRVYKSDANEGLQHTTCVFTVSVASPLPSIRGLTRPTPHLGPNFPSPLLTRRSNGMIPVRTTLPMQTVPPLSFSFSFSSDGPSLTLPIFSHPRFFSTENLLQRVETALRHPRERGKATAALHPRSFQIIREETPLSRAHVLGSCDGSFPFVFPSKGSFVPFRSEIAFQSKGKGTRWWNRGGKFVHRR